jgi:phenylpyruvate tautomerase PptA (4-oxalocrotonate tautomerase family)
MEMVMPATRIETRAGWLDGRQSELLEAVQRALIEGIRIPETDRDVRLHELPADAMLLPPHRTERFTFIEISMFVGRSVDAKRRLYAALVRELGAFGVAPPDIKVLIHEAERENWSVGGVALSDVELGFKVEV